MENHDEIVLSVIICCYNSHDIIDTTLLYLENQSGLNFINYEVVIVDNASTDSTYERVINYKSDTSLNINLVSEPNSGLMNARLKGIKSSLGRYIVFVDDDNWLDTNYLSNVVSIFNENAKISILGGISRLPEELDCPESILPYMKSYAVGRQYDSERELVGSETMWGAGLSFRKNELLKVINHDFLCIGRSKKIQLSGDDTELCIVLIRNGARAMYSNSLKLQHNISLDRFTMGKLKLMNSGFGASLPMLRTYVEPFQKRSLKNKLTNSVIHFRIGFILLAIYKIIVFKLKNDSISLAFWQGTFSSLRNKTLWAKIKLINK